MRRKIIKRKMKFAGETIPRILDNIIGSPGIMLIMRSIREKKIQKRE